MSPLEIVIAFWGVAFLLVLLTGWLIGRARFAHAFLQRLVDSLAQDEPAWAREFERRLEDREWR